MSIQLPPLQSLFTAQLPADPDTSNSCRSVKEAYSWVSPTPTKQAQVICCNQTLALQLGFTETSLNSEVFSALVSGNHKEAYQNAYAMNYGGYQFGQWAGQLGDGRAINLGQYVTKENQTFTLQLKGAGKTPYSRRADGMAVLRSSIREYLCSEAMFHLGIPTTRALSLTLTGEQVIRDKLYDGRSAYEPCAIVARVSPSFLRFGSIQLPAHRGDLTLLKQTVEYSITQDFPHILSEQKTIDKTTYLRWFNEISERTAQLIVNWMRVGFVHGVLNTDNMSLIGETIDFGPYGWIDNFDLNWTPNTSDAAEKRYRFGQQAYIGQWNLFQLANAIYPLIDEAQPLQDILGHYNHLYQSHWLNMMREKIGVAIVSSDDPAFNDTDLQLCKDLEALLSLIDTDMTLFYRALANVTTHMDCVDQLSIKRHFNDCFYDTTEVTPNYLTQLSLWLNRYQHRLSLETQTDEQRKAKMDAINPCYILRNFQVQQAIELAEQGDYTRVITLAELIKTPYQQQNKFKQFEAKRPDWAKHQFGCSALSCSS